VRRSDKILEHGLARWRPTDDGVGGKGGPVPRPFLGTPDYAPRSKRRLRPLTFAPTLQLGATWFLAHSQCRSGVSLHAEVATATDATRRRWSRIIAGRPTRLVAFVRSLNFFFIFFFSFVLCVFLFFFFSLFVNFFFVLYRTGHPKRSDTGRTRRGDTRS